MNRDQPGQTQEKQSRRPGALRDIQLLVVLSGAFLTGIALWSVLPHGFAADVFHSPLALLNVLLLYPLVEEWLFRGVIQPALLSRPPLAIRNLGISRANLITSLLFVGLHLVNHSPGWALAVLAPSLVLGHIRERYDNLLAPILLHIFFNIIYLAAGTL